MNIIEISSSITHIEDLTPAEFVSVVRKLDEYEITEKVDGAQLLFGLDEKGFYTSRESKGGTRVYEASDYPIAFSNTHMSSAHRLLKRVLPQLKEAGLRKGDQIEVEVLFGELPNVVPYSADTSYLIFLRTTAGNTSINSLKEHLEGKSFTVCIDRPVTRDGRTVALEEDINIWKFARVPTISVDLNSLKRQLNGPLSEMVTYLKSDSGINGIPNSVIESTPLNKCPQWCDASDWKLYKDLVKEKKEEIRNTLREEHMMQIKHILLNSIVRNRASMFGPLLEDGGWIEGVVLKHKSSGDVVKLVDKSTFGTIREFAWGVRNTLTESARSIENPGSFLGKMHVQMATALGHSALGTMQAKNYLRKTGDTTEERLLRLSEGVNFQSVREYWIALLESKEDELLKNLHKYEEEKHTMVLSIPEKSRAGISYTVPSIDQRTKETFAALFERISMYRTDVEKAISVKDLIHLLVGKQLGGLT